MNNKLLDRILNDVSLDERVKDGMFNIEENDHMEVLRDYLSKKGINEDVVREFSNRVLEGKYPERQAFNTKGILVTFPTPEYKAAALKRGTHFEEDPTKKASNIFSGGTPTSPEKKETDQPSVSNTTEPKTSLPVSQSPLSNNDEKDDKQPDIQPQTDAAPQQTPTSSKSAEQPIEEPSELPPEEKSPEEKEADKNAIKSMLKGDDYMLENNPTFDRRSLYESAKAAECLITLFINGNLPKKNDVKVIIEQLQKSLVNNDDLKYDWN